MQVLAGLFINLPKGTNLGLSHFMWMLVNGALLSNRGALFPALKASGLADATVRRAWAAFHGGGWQIAELLRLWQAQIEELPQWRYHQHGGYRAVSVAITAFYRPQLKDCPSKHYYPPAGKALPAVIIGLVGVSGSLNGQRLAVPREILPVKSHDRSEKHLKIDLLEQVVRKLSSDEGAVMDAGFKLSQVQQAGLKGYLLRLAKNFIARRNEPAPRKEKGRPPIYAEWVRPLGRTYADNEIPASPPDQVVTWQEDGRKNRAEIWTNLLLPGVVPHPNNETFQVLAIYDPLYAQPWLLATDLPIAAPDVKALYQDHCPVEQIPLAALSSAHMVAVHRHFVFAQENIQRLPELALSGGSIQKFLAASLPVTATGFWDCNPLPNSP